MQNNQQVTNKRANGLNLIMQGHNDISGTCSLKRS